MQTPTRSLSQLANDLAQLARSLAQHDDPFLEELAHQIAASDATVEKIAPILQLADLLDRYEQEQDQPSPTSQHDQPETQPTRQVDPRNKLNALTGGEWLYFTKSTITTTYPKEFGHKLRQLHGASKPPRLMKQLIEFFTKPGDLVLDPFMGAGGTLIGASICRRRRDCIGIEINPEWIEIYKSVCRNEGLEPQEVQEGDCLIAMGDIASDTVDFIATDPPYNTHLEQTMSGGPYADKFTNRRTDYNMRSDKAGDLANAEDYGAYLDGMEQAFTECYRILKQKKYMAVIIRNAYQNSHYILTNADLADRARKVGFVLKGEKIWYQAGTRLRPYGYPYAYVPNITHQFIMIFRKGK